MRSLDLKVRVQPLIENRGLADGCKTVVSDALKEVLATVWGGNRGLWSKARIAFFTNENYLSNTL